MTKPTQVVFKLKPEGTCECITLADIFTTPIKGFDLRTFDEEMVIALCVGAGCDYLDNPAGFGIKNSHKVVSAHRTVARVLRNMKLTGLLPLRPAASHLREAHHGLLEYEYGFYCAVATFRHQVVFDGSRRETCHLTPVDPDRLPPCLRYLWDLRVDGGDGEPLAAAAAGGSSGSSGFSFCGTLLPAALACGIADGLLDPVTKQPFDLPECTKRTRQLFRGADRLVQCKNNEVVTALREIAAGKVRFQIFEARTAAAAEEANPTSTLTQ